jgi:hypothetical protein
VNKRMFLLNTFLRKVEFNFKCKSCKCWMNIWNFHFLDCINFLSQVKREDFFSCIFTWRFIKLLGRIWVRNLLELSYSI